MSSGGANARKTNFRFFSGRIPPLFVKGEDDSTEVGEELAKLHVLLGGLKMEYLEERFILAFDLTKAHDLVAALSQLFLVTRR